CRKPHFRARAGGLEGAGAGSVGGGDRRRDHGPDPARQFFAADARRCARRPGPAGEERSAHAVAARGRLLPPPGDRTPPAAGRVLLHHGPRPVEGRLPPRAPPAQSLGDLSPLAPADRAVAARPAHLRRLLSRALPPVVAAAGSSDRTDARHGRPPARALRSARRTDHRDSSRLPPEPRRDATAKTAR